MTDKPRFKPSGPLISIAALVAMALLFGLAEGGTRLVAPERCNATDARARSIEFALKFLTPCYTREQRGGETWIVGTRGSGPGEPNAMPLKKTPGTVRIAVIGESSAHMLSDSAEKIAAARTCGQRYEIVKCGLSGASREHVERRFDEAIEYEPDAVLFVFGHNVGFEMPTDASRLRTERLAAHSCLLSLNAPIDMPADTSGEDPLNRRLAGLDAFLRRAARVTRERHAALVVATMAGNLWLPPAEPMQGIGDDPRELEARYLEAIGRPGDALAALRAAPGPSPPLYAGFRLGVRLARSGDEKAAYAELHRSLESDARRTRAPARANDLIRRLAAEEKLPLRDTERALERTAPAGLPGWESFIDNVHLRDEVRGREALSMMKLARAAIGIPAEDPCDPADPTRGERSDLGSIYRGVLGLTNGSDAVDEDRWLRGLAFAVESWARADPPGTDRATAAFVGSAELARATDVVRGRMLENIAEGFFAAGRDDAALPLNALARGMGAAGAWVQLGLYRLRKGDAAAAREAFERALSIDGRRADARHFLDRMRRDAAPGGARDDAGPR